MGKYDRFIHALPGGRPKEYRMRYVAGVDPHLPHRPGGPMIIDACEMPEITHHIEVFTIVASGTDYIPGHPGFEVADLAPRVWKQMVFGQPEDVWPPTYRTKEGKIFFCHRPMYHTKDEMFLFVGTNPDDPTDLGGEVELWLGIGDRAERKVITKPSLVFIPAGLVHCPMAFRNVRRPLKEIVIFDSAFFVGEFGVNEWPPDYKAEKAGPAQKGKYDRFVHELAGGRPKESQLRYVGGVDPHLPHRPGGPMIIDSRHMPEMTHHIEVFTIVASGTDYRGPGHPGFEVTSGTQVAGGQVVFGQEEDIWPPTYRTKDGKVLFCHRPMYHTRDEMFLFIGTNPDDPSDLGGEVELWLGLGDRAEKHMITKSSIVFLPAGLVHTPIAFRNVRRPFKEIVIFDGPRLAEFGVDEWPPDFRP